MRQLSFWGLNDVMQVQRGVTGACVATEDVNTGVRLNQSSRQRVWNAPAPSAGESDHRVDGTGHEKKIHCRFKNPMAVILHRQLFSLKSQTHLWMCHIVYDHNVMLTALPGYSISCIFFLWCTFLINSKLKIPRMPFKPDVEILVSFSNCQWRHCTCSHSLCRASNLPHDGSADSESTKKSNHSTSQTHFWRALIFN